MFNIATLTQRIVQLCKDDGLNVLILNALPPVEQDIKQNLPMPFNMSEMRRSIGGYQLLTSAELRLQIKKPGIQKEQRVELYEGLGAGARYLASRFLTNKDKGLTFDITETLQKWLQSDGRPVCLPVCLSVGPRRSV